jgi:DNA phosphorothioation-dependent restriction protein DptH
MTKKITRTQRKQICELLEQRHDRNTIAGIVGVTPSQVSAVAAHVTMGTYEHHKLQPDRNTTGVSAVVSFNIQEQRSSPEGTPSENAQRILLGYDRSGTPLHWDPVNSVNPHVLIAGESGYGKTYSISCLVAELSQRGIPSIIFDYGQGFTATSSNESFLQTAKPNQLQAARNGIQVSPFEIFPSDLHGPVNVAQRVADTLTRVYQGIGVQQHAVIRDAVIEVFEDAGIHKAIRNTWKKPLPRFGLLQQKLHEYGEDLSNSDRKTPRTAASHISSLFVFDIFRKNGTPIRWNDLLRSKSRPTIIQLLGIEQDLQRAVTEFMIWNLIGFAESSGPDRLRCFVVIDEAHRMVSGPGSAVDKLLREGRKFGIGVILASQQPEDFTAIAFSNTATKLMFQISDDKATVSKRLHRKLQTPMPFSELYTIVTTLPRGEVFAITNNLGGVIKFTSFKQRFGT